MSIDEIKALLPRRSYRTIAEAVGVKEDTVRQYFSKAHVRLSGDTVVRIREEACSIIERNSLNGLALLHGEEKIEEVRATLAA